MKHTKNHVKKHGNTIAARTARTFNIDESAIKACLSGDEKALQLMGARGKEGERILQLMPIVVENAKSFIQGTEEYNKGLAEIYKQGSRSGIAIDKAGSGLALENQKYRNERSEIAADFNSKKRLEQQRHVEYMDMVRVKAFIDYQMSKTDQQYQLESTLARPGIAQLQEDDRYQLESAKHLLAHGDESDLSLLPRKEFNNSAIGKVTTAIKGFFK